MKSYKHYSFDIWKTLLKSHPDYKTKRAEYFYIHFNRQRRSLEEVKEIIYKIDVMCNWTAETAGRNIDAIEMYAMVLHSLDYELSPLSFRDLVSIYHMTENIIMDHLPVFVTPDIPEVLFTLRQRGCNLSILSNTGFIKGVTMKKVLGKLGLEGMFQFQIYSDEVGYSKPNVEAFNLLVQTINKFSMHNPVGLKDILHIGDNELADVSGSALIGIDSYKVDGNTARIKDVLL